MSPEFPRLIICQQFVNFERGEISSVKRAFERSLLGLKSKDMPIFYLFNSNFRINSKNLILKNLIFTIIDFYLNVIRIHP